MCHTISKLFFSILCMSLIPVGAGAALIDRGSGLIYDDVLDITWLQNANLAAGSIYDQTSNGSQAGLDPGLPCCSPTDGLMTWENSMAWAENLVFEGYDDWRLPTLEVTVTEVNPGGFLEDAAGCMTSPKEDCVSNEYSYMHRYNLGAEPPTHGPNSNRTGDLDSVDGIPFYGVQNVYWTSIESGSSAYGFRFDSGGFGSDVNLDYEFGAWAVRDGDSTPGGVAVPEPSSLILMVVGALALVLREQRNK